MSDASTPCNGGKQELMHYVYYLGQFLFATVRWCRCVRHDKHWFRSYCLILKQAVSSNNVFMAVVIFSNVIPKIMMAALMNILTTNSRMTSFSMNLIMKRHLTRLWMTLMMIQVIMLVLKLRHCEKATKFEKISLLF